MSLRSSNFSSNRNGVSRMSIVTSAPEPVSAMVLTRVGSDPTLVVSYTTSMPVAFL